MNPPSSSSEYLYRLRPVRPEMVHAPTDEESRILSEHFRYLSDLADSGEVRLAGRTLLEGEEAFGIVILRSPSESGARELMENDPAVRHGVMRAELFPFRTAIQTPRP